MGEEQPAGWAYHIPDALGSVRQLTDADAGVILARAYEPFGSVMASSGLGETSYSFTGEWADGTGLVFLRSRFYNPIIGIFTIKDIWEGSETQPISSHPWQYSYRNPITFTDPSGRDPWWCEGRFDEASCYAKWIIEQGLELKPELVESIYFTTPLEALRLIQEKFNIQLPPGYQFRFASKNSPLFRDIWAGGFGLWFWEINSSETGETIYDVLIEITSNSCAMKNLFDQLYITQIDYGVYITDLAFTEFSFYPDDVAGIMIHEAVHAWQEHVARELIKQDAFLAQIATSTWHQKYQNGMERQADTIAMEDERINMSSKLRSLLKEHKDNRREGNDFPIPLPAGVP